MHDFAHNGISPSDDVRIRVDGALAESSPFGLAAVCLSLATNAWSTALVSYSAWYAAFACSIINHMNAIHLVGDIAGVLGCIWTASP